MWVGAVLQEHIGCCEVVVSHLLSFCAAQPALDHLRDRFIREVDATTIVRELEYRGIISDGVQQEVTAASGRVVQSQILHAHLVRRCTKEALLDVCEVMIAVEGNPIMRALGEDMKRALRGKCCVCSCIHVHCIHVLIACTWC